MNNLYLRAFFATLVGAAIFFAVLGDVIAVLGILIYFLVVNANRFAAATVDVVDGQTVARVHAPIQASWPPS